MGWLSAINRKRKHGVLGLCCVIELLDRPTVSNKDDRLIKVCTMCSLRERPDSVLFVVHGDGLERLHRDASGQAACRLYIYKREAVSLSFPRSQGAHCIECR